MKKRGTSESDLGRQWIKAAGAKGQTVTRAAKGTRSNSSPQQVLLCLNGHQNTSISLVLMLMKSNHDDECREKLLGTSMIFHLGAKLVSFAVRSSKSAGYCMFEQKYHQHIKFWSKKSKKTVTFFTRDSAKSVLGLFFTGKMNWWMDFGWNCPFHAH